MDSSTHIPEAVEPTSDYAKYLTCVAERQRCDARIVELARVLRDPTNNAQMTELLDLLTEGA